MLECHQSRTVILAADFTTWHQDVVRAWSDIVIPQFEVDIHLVYPTTPDVAQGVIAQLMLVQRPDQFQRSIVVTISDTEIQRGLPRSRAIVDSDRVYLHNILLMTGYLYECPPEFHANRCHLWFEGQELTGNNYHATRHGDAFMLHVIRERDLQALEHLTYSEEQLQIGLASLISRPTGVAYAPDWYNSLEVAFEAGSAVEMLEEGNVAYILTWFVDADRHHFCQQPRPVRLTADRRSWRVEILAMWQFDLTPQCPAELHFVDPIPPKAPWEGHIAHIIITQRADPDHAAVLISATSWEDYPHVHQNLHYIPHMASMMDIINRHAPERCRGRACRVRRGNQIFDHQGRSQIGNGDGLEIEIMPPIQPSEDHLNLLQIGKQLQSKQYPVTISLEATLPLKMDYVPENHHMPEVLVTENAHTSDYLMADDLGFSSLPIGTNLTATSLHALQEPHKYQEIDLAGKIALYVDGSALPTSSAWAVVAVAYDNFGGPKFAGALARQVGCDPNSAQWIGATHHDNIAAEITASVAAHITAPCLEDTANIVIRPDLRLSTMLSKSLWTCSSHGKLAEVARWIGGAYHEHGGQVREVRGHTAHPWNDLADAVAKLVAKMYIQVGNIDLTKCHEAVINGDIKWNWMWNKPSTLKHVFPPGTVPNSWVATPAARKLNYAYEECKEQESPWKQIDFKIATANVLALNDKNDFQDCDPVASRAERLDSQWHQEGWAVVGVQESRRKEGRYQTTHYSILASGPKVINGIPHYGCELLLHKTMTISKGEKVTLTTAKLAAAWADPRRLVVNLTGIGTAISFAVLHAPCKSSTTSIEQVREWWDETAKILREACLADLAWILIDANAPLATKCSEFFGTVGAEVSNEQGSAFESFLEENKIYAPTTMSWCHRGDHHTWKHPRGNKLRCDYVLCTEKALECCWASWTTSTQDFGFTHDDHLPVCLHIRGWWPAIASPTKPRWDRLAMLDPRKCKEFQEALETLPIPCWSVHADDHAAIWQHSVMQLAMQHFTTTTKEKTRPRLSEATLALIQLKRSALDYGRRHDLLKDEHYKNEMKLLERQVRKAVSEDQKQFYEHLVTNLREAGDLKDFRLVYQLLSRLGGRPAHKTGQKWPLPLLKSKEGRPLGSFLDQQRMWLRQFAEVEGGIPMSRESLHQMMPPSLGLPPDVVDTEAIPTADQLARKIRMIKRGKAPGPDGIPPDIIKAGAGPMVNHIAAMTTKVALRGREPNEWRGGRLVPLHKGKLHRSDPEGYRFIFINNVVAKLYHSTLRDHLARAWQGKIKHIQFGGREGCSTDTPHLLIQEHFRHSATKRMPAAALFVDFRATFYTVIRQGLFELPIDDTAFTTVLTGMGIEKKRIEQLIQQATHDNATKGISKHAQFLLTDMFKSTFFQLEGLPEVALTTRGTRPGDPVGDVLFNMLMTVILEDVTNFIQSKTRASWQGNAAPVQDLGVHRDVENYAWCEVAFVDDLAVLLRAPTQEELHALIEISFRAVYEAATRRGLMLNMEAGKTEVLRAFVGSGAKKRQTTVGHRQLRHANHDRRRRATPQSGSFL